MKYQTPQRQTGLIVVPPPTHSQRLVQLLSSSIQEQPIPSIKHIWKLGPILNQQQTSACVAFAWGQFIQSEPIYYIPSRNMLQWCYRLYREAQRVDPFEGEEPEYFGTTIEAGYQILKKRNLVSNDLFWSNEISEIIRYLIEKGPLVVSARWGESMEWPNSQGYIRVKPPLNRGGHAWLIYGVSTLPSAPPHFLGVNSWGTTWGIQGRFRIKFTDFETLLNYGGYVCTTLQKA